MEKVRPWCGQPSDLGRLRNRTEQNVHSLVHSIWSVQSLVGRRDAVSSQMTLDNPVLCPTRNSVG